MLAIVIINLCLSICVYGVSVYMYTYIYLYVLYVCAHVPTNTEREQGVTYLTLLALSYLFSKFGQSIFLSKCLLDCTF